MKDTVEAAGLLDSLLGFLKDALNSLTQMGIDYEADPEAKKKAEETEAKKAKAEGRKPRKIVSEYYTIDVVDEDAGEDADGNKKTKSIGTMMLTPTKQNTFYATLTFDGGEVRRSEKALSKDQLAKWVQKTISAFGYDTYEDVRKTHDREFNVTTNEATRIRATLRKVESATDTSVELVAVDPTVDAHAALTALSAIADDDGFVQQLTQEPQTYDITELDDSYEISNAEPCDAMCDAQCSVIRILREGMVALGKVMQIQWNLTGPQRPSLSDRCDTILWRLRDLVRWAAQQAATYGSVPGPAELLSEDLDHTSYPHGIDADRALELLKDVTGAVLDLLNCLYCNFDGSAQLTISQIVRDIDAAHSELVISTK